MRILQLRQERGASGGARGIDPGGGHPSPKEWWADDFEAADLAWTAAPGEFALSTAGPVDGKQSLAWVAGNNVAAVAADSIDLTGVEGATLGMVLDFHPAQSSDVVIVEALKTGSAVWTEIAVLGGIIPPTAYQSFGLQDLDGSRFRLRFRTSLASRFSSTGRSLKIDDIRVAIPDPTPSGEPVYSVIAGTSLAAPHVTAYVGLQRLACDRMGLAWSRARALEGVVPEASLAGKVSTGGRLDAYKGLEFYLSTLPDIRIRDSTAHVWTEGGTVSYSLSLSPAPSESYAFTGTSLPQGATLDGSGMLTWIPAAGQAGEYTVRLLAEGPTELRKAFSISIREPLPVAARAPGTSEEGVWRWAGQSFLLRPELRTGRHLVEVFATNAAGKVRLLERDWMEGRAFSRPRSGSLPPGEATRLQIRVDGIYLASSR